MALSGLKPLAVTLTQLYHTKKATLSDIVRLMSENPRKVLKLEQVTLKREVSRYYNSRPEKYGLLTLKSLFQSQNSVFKGETLKGKVLYTISKGK